MASNTIIESTKRFPSANELEVDFKVLVGVLSVGK